MSNDPRNLAMYTTELLDEARKFMHHMLTKVVEYGGSDLFITADFPPSNTATFPNLSCTCDTVNSLFQTTKILKYLSHLIK